MSRVTQHKHAESAVSTHFRTGGGAGDIWLLAPTGAVENDMCSLEEERYLEYCALPCVKKQGQAQHFPLLYFFSAHEPPFLPFFTFLALWNAIWP